MLRTDATRVPAPLHKDVGQCHACGTIGHRSNACPYKQVNEVGEGGAQGEITDDNSSANIKEYGGRDLGGFCALDDKITRANKKIDELQSRLQVVQEEHHYELQRCKQDHEEEIDSIS